MPVDFRAIHRLTRAVQEPLITDPALSRRYQLLPSIPGFGITSAERLLVELATLAPDLNVRQWVAYLGLDPRERSHDEGGFSFKRESTRVVEPQRSPGAKIPKF